MTGDLLSQTPSWFTEEVFYPPAGGKGSSQTELRGVGGRIGYRTIVQMAALTLHYFSVSSSTEIEGPMDCALLNGSTDTVGC